MGRPDHLIAVWDRLTQSADQIAILFWVRVTDCSRNVDRRCPGRDRRVDALTQEVKLGAGRVFRAPLAIID